MSDFMPVFKLRPRETNPVVAFTKGEPLVKTTCVKNTFLHYTSEQTPLKTSKSAEGLLERSPYRCVAKKEKVVWADVKDGEDEGAPAPRQLAPEFDAAVPTVATAAPVVAALRPSTPAGAAAELRLCTKDLCNEGKGGVLGGCYSKAGYLRSGGSKHGARMWDMALRPTVEDVRLSALTIQVFVFGQRGEEHTQCQFPIGIEFQSEKEELDHLKRLGRSTWPIADATGCNVRLVGRGVKDDKHGRKFDNGEALQLCVAHRGQGKMHEAKRMVSELLHGIYMEYEEQHPGQHLVVCRHDGPRAGGRHKQKWW